MMNAYDILNGMKWYNKLWFIPALLITISAVSAYRWVMGK